MPPMQRGILRPQPDQTSNQSFDSDEMELPAPNTETSFEREVGDTVDATFYPSILDALTVRYLLQWKVVPGGIPPEIADMIIEAAEYWASMETRIDGKIVVRQDADRELLRTAPLCYEKVCVTSFSLLLDAYQTNTFCRHQMDRYPSPFYIGLPTPAEKSCSPLIVTTKVGEESQNAEVHTGGRIPGSTQKSFRSTTKTKRVKKPGQNQANRISCPTETNCNPT